MRNVLLLLRKSVLTFVRARAAIVITFVVPVVLIYLFGHVFGLYRHDSGPAGIPLAVVNASPEPAAAELVRALRAEKGLQIISDAPQPGGGTRPLTEAEVRAGLRDNRYRFALILPPDLVTSERLGVRFLFLTNPRNEIEAQTVSGLVQKTVFANVPQLLGASLQAAAAKQVGHDRLQQFTSAMADAIARTFGGDRAEIQRQIESGNPVPNLRRLEGGATPRDATAPTAKSAPAEALSRLVRFETEQVVGRDVKNPMAARLVGGYAIMFLLFAVSGSAASLFEERKSGVFLRLLSSPVTPAHILWARFLFGVLLGLAQIGALFVAGRILFGLDIVSHAGALLMVALAAAGACSAFGMLIAAVAPSEEAASGLSTLVVLSMSAIGGAWFPISFMPEYIQVLSKFTLVYWAVEGFTDVLWAGVGFADVLPKIAILWAIAGGVMAVAVWRFQRARLLG